MSWALKYFTLSFKKSWGGDTTNYFYKEVLRISDSPFDMGQIVVPIFIGMLLIWGANWLICYKGVKHGIEKLSKIVLPTLFAIMIVIVIKGITLEGASLGLNKLFTPNWEKVSDPKVWVAAYGQVFFSLSIATGIMMTYSSYLPEKTDINNSAFMTAFANCSFEFLSAIGVFAILGFMANSQGLSVEEVASSGIGLAFIAFPKVFSLMGIWGNILGVLFFACLLFAGLTSAVSLVEAITSPILDKTKFERKTVVTGICIAGCISSLFFARQSGLYLLDIMDNFINNYGIVVVGFLESIFIGWVVRPETIRTHTNSISYFDVGKWWDIVIKYVIPIILGFMLIQSIMTEMITPYGGYSRLQLLIFGWSIIFVGIVSANIISRKKWQNQKINFEKN